GRRTPPAAAPRARARLPPAAHRARRQVRGCRTGWARAARRGARSRSGAGRPRTAPAGNNAPPEAAAAAMHAVRFRRPSPSSRRRLRRRARTEARTTAPRALRLRQCGSRLGGRDGARGALGAVRRAPPSCGALHAEDILRRGDACETTLNPGFKWECLETFGLPAAGRTCTPGFRCTPVVAFKGQG